MDDNTADAVDIDEAVPDGTGELTRNMKIGWNLGNTFDASSDLVEGMMKAAE